MLHHISLSHGHKSLFQQLAVMNPLGTQQSTYSAFSPMTLTSWCRVLPQLVKKFPAFYRTQKFITMFTRAWSTHPKISHLISLRPIHTHTKWALTVWYGFLQSWQSPSLNKFPSTHSTQRVIGMFTVASCPSTSYFLSTLILFFHPHQDMTVSSLWAS